MKPIQGESSFRGRHAPFARCQPPWYFSEGLDLALSSVVAQSKVAGREVLRLACAFHAREKVEISTALVAGSFG